MAHLLPRLTLGWTNTATFKLTGQTAMPKLLSLPFTHQWMTAMFSAASQSCLTHRGVWSLLGYHWRCEVKHLLRRPGRTPKVTCSKKVGEFPSGTLLHVLSLLPPLTCRTKPGTFASDVPLSEAHLLPPLTRWLTNPGTFDKIVI